MVYTSVENSYIKSLKKLQSKKYREESNLFLIEGEHLVLEAYKSGYLKKIILEENSSFKIDVETLYVSSNVMSYLSELENPTMIGICEVKKNEIKGNKIVVLDNIQDPGNLGTIIRSCVAFGIDTLCLINCVDEYNSKVLRASQGMNFHLNIVRIDYDDMDLLKKSGYHIYGTKVTDGNDVKKVAKYEKFVIIMGNEGKGLSARSISLCDEFIYIAMDELCESLNVGVATSIILYEMVGK